MSLQTLCSKLGVSTSCLSYAQEYNELLDARISSSSLSALKLPGSCRLVICLDLAAKHAGVTPSKSDIVRLSGVTKKSYDEAFKVVSALLGVEEQHNLRDLAVQFGCTRIIPQAADILQRYTQDQCGDIDFGTPMFLCCALLLAARNDKLKINTAKLKEISGAKKSTFDRLVADMQKYVIVVSETKKQSSSKKRGGLMEAIDAQIQEDEKSAKRRKTDEEDIKDETEDSNTNYEEWKRKILAKAGKK